jgi:hypothetical protein
MSSLDAMKQAIAFWRSEQSDSTIASDGVPDWVRKFCIVIYRLRKEVYNLRKDEWEYEGQ